MEDSSIPVVREEAVPHLQGLVRNPPWLLRVPPELEAGLEVRRADTFARLVGPGTPLIVALVVAISLAGILLFDVRVANHDGRVWWAGESATALITMAVLFLVRLPAFSRGYASIVAVGSGSILAIKLLESIAFEDHAMATYAASVCALTTNIIVLAFRLPPRISVAACAVAAVLSTCAALALGLPLQWERFPVFVTVSTCVSLGIAHFTERQERVSYLQSVLLAHESERSRRLNAELAQIAQTDPLTGIANRRHFDAQLKGEWERARRSAQSVALLFVDVDHFKAFNDTYGHQAGDACLVRLAGVLKSLARRPADLAARYGGEEFVLLLPDTDLEGAQILARAVIEAVDALAIPHRTSEVTSTVTVSVGVAAKTATLSVESDELLRSADENVYRAKAEGRHRVSIAPAAR